MALLFDNDQGLIQNVLILDPGANILTFDNVQAVQLPSGTTAQRPGSPINGTLRNNSDYGFSEEYVNGSWQPIFSEGGSSNNSFFEDFLVPNATLASGFGRLGWLESVTGAGAAVSGITSLLTSGNNAFGVIDLSTGTTTNGIASAYLTSNAIMFGYATIYAEWRVQMTNISSTAQPYNVRLGFNDVWTTVGPQNGAYFFGTGGNTPAWNCITINGGTATSTPSGISHVDSTWYKLGILVNAAASSVQFFIDDSLVVTNTTNIPTANETGFGCQISKSSAGTTARTIDVDYAQLTYALTTPR